MESIERLREWIDEHTDRKMEFCTYPPRHSVKGTAEDLLALVDRVEAELAERYMELPVDADGVPVRVGDTMRDEFPDHEMVTFVVHGYTCELPNGRGRMMPADEDGTGFYAHQLRHHTPPTVESVLREFADDWSHAKGGCDEDGIFEMYAAKLRLAEEVE